MAYDSQATRGRLLDAAYAEFSAVGLAGSRVDRIAAGARANKQAIYAHFGSKDELFDAVLEWRLKSLSDLVPLDAADLPGYAVGLFYVLLEDEELYRLTQWGRLERERVQLAELASHQQKARSIADALTVSEGAARDLLMLTLGLAQAWVSTAQSFRLGAEDASARHLNHTSLLAAGVRALVDEAKRTGADEARLPS